MVNPTFSLGIYSFPNLSAFLRNVPNNFIGLTPDTQFDRYWRFTLFGFYAQDTFRVTPRLTLNGGLRYRFTTMPEDIYGRNFVVAFVDLCRVAADNRAALRKSRPSQNLSPRPCGVGWDVFGDRTSRLQGGYGLYLHTTDQQNLIVTVSNPPATPRPVIVNPSFPTPDFNRAGDDLQCVRVQFHLDNPRVHVSTSTYSGSCR